MDLLASNGAPSPSPEAAAASQQKTADTLPDMIKVEHQLIRVPHEHLKKSIRVSSRLAEKDVNAVVAGLSEAIEKGMSKEEAIQHLDNLVSRLQGLKRKLDECSKAELEQSQRCLKRAEHLSLMSQGMKENPRKWNQMRVDRILIDHMLRSSYYNSAQKLAKQSGLQDLVDLEIFVEARKVIEALRRRDCSEALAWCSTNKARLKKNKSKLEFKLRIQEFIELVRGEKTLNAIAYARKQLAPWGGTDMKELQQAMATLAFRSSTECAPYKALFADEQWASLAKLFQDEFLQMYGMTTQSLLDIYLQAGLSALKTPFGADDECPKEDPLSQEAFRQLAAPLPLAKHVRSKLVCRISKEIMDDHNPPLVLPNGFVYSKKAMEEMARKNNGKISCPRSGAVFNFDQLTKAFIF